ncbi:hypothetical protein [Polaribacter staleyi]|uniref:hypothetical protein n=1 Tax=Polaribacter staleyi TaxID=2022337 RepID=UPI0031BA03C0
MKETTNLTNANIKNLTSLWQTASESINAYFKEPKFDYSLIEYSEWPNRLWFNQEISKNTIALAKERLLSTSTNLIIPYWDIYNSNSFEILEQNGFVKKFEQTGMSLKVKHLFDELKILK